MPRVTKADLERENAELKAELVQRRERSRSRRRKAQVVAAPMDATTRRALDVVRKHDRDGVIEEQRATIARLVQERTAANAQHALEKKALEEGSGRMGPIIIKSWTHSTLDERQTNQILAGEETVLEFVMRWRRMIGAMEGDLVWNGSHYQQVVVVQRY